MQICKWGLNSVGTLLTSFVIVQPSLKIQFGKNYSINRKRQKTSDGYTPYNKDMDNLSDCIEPLEKNYIKLKARKSENTIALNCAVGNKNGYVYMNIASNDGQSSSILELDDYHNFGAPQVKFIGVEKVKISKLSKILQTVIHKKIFVKIDTQGYEFEILKSINQSDFNNIYAFEIEANLVSTYKKSTYIEDLIKFLRKRGYQPLRIENGFGMPNFGQQLQVDILFVKTRI